MRRDGDDDGRAIRPSVPALLGPAFVAAIAYVDPGNVASNLSAGSTYGYALVWVLLLANLMAVVVQYRSAKLGIVTGAPLAAIVVHRLNRRGRGWAYAYGAQAFVVAVATDIAEVVGGALGLALLFGLPLWIGGILVGAITLVLLAVLRRQTARAFEMAVGAFGALVVVAFVGGLLMAPPDPFATVRGLWPTIPDQGAWALAAAMLGATVMPHAIYLHSSLAVDRYRRGGRPVAPIPYLLRAQRWDVGLALVGAGTANIAMLLYGAAALSGAVGDTIESAHEVLGRTLGPVAAVMLGVGLLASGIGSAIVGTHAGSRIARDALPISMTPTVRRAITIGPAVALLLLGASPTFVLVVSQIVLSFGIVFAAAPLLRITSDRTVMGDHADIGIGLVAGWVIVGLIVALNIALLVSLVI